jgi:hypothetical protein
MRCHHHHYNLLAASRPIDFSLRCLPPSRLCTVDCLNAVSGSQVTCDAVDTTSQPLIVEGWRSRRLALNPMSLWAVVGAVLLVIGASAVAAPVAPLMPSTFVASFTNPTQDPLQPLTGVWYYDWVNGRQRVDGGNQESCNRVRPAGDYCTTFLTGTSFYVVFPFIKQCVKSEGPGLVASQDERLFAQGSSKAYCDRTGSDMTMLPFEARNA